MWKVMLCCVDCLHRQRGVLSGGESSDQVNSNRLPRTYHCNWCQKPCFLVFHIWLRHFDERLLLMKHWSLSKETEKELELQFRNRSIAIANEMYWSNIFLSLPAMDASFVCRGREDLLWLSSERYLPDIGVF